MKLKLTFALLTFALTFALLFTACKKNKDAEPAAPEIPLLDKYAKGLTSTDYLSPLPDVSTTDYYIKKDFWWGATYSAERAAFTWSPDIFGSNAWAPEWDYTYKVVKYADQVLTGLDTMQVVDSNRVQWKQVRGQALFLRSYFLYDIAQNFAPVYDNATADATLGIPTSGNMTRPTLKETYSVIIDSIKQAIPLLPEPATGNILGSKPAACALLARVYMGMRNYDSATVYARAALDYHNKLADYNSLDTANAKLYAFATANPEIMFRTEYDSDIFYYLRVSDPDISVDTTLYYSYAANDLRRDIKFKLNNSTGNIALKADGYSTSNGFTNGHFFNGLATDEVYLIIAECLARKGDTFNAMAYLNELVAKRYIKGYTIPDVSSAQEALQLILTERRKELPFRGLRWYDLKRLNKEGANITLQRVFAGVTYTLAPNSPLYVFPIPGYVIKETGMQQNSR
jgi:hypothetical protein